MKIDIFNHILPKGYLDKTVSVAPGAKDMGQRARSVSALFDMDERFKIMDMFDDYTQVVCLAAPPIEGIWPAACFDRTGDVCQ